MQDKMESSWLSERYKFPLLINRGEDVACCSKPVLYPSLWIGVHLFPEGWVNGSARLAPRAPSARLPFWQHHSTCLRKQLSSDFPPKTRDQRKGSWAGGCYGYNPQQADLQICLSQSWEPIFYICRWEGSAIYMYIYIHVFFIYIYII